MKRAFLPALLVAALLVATSVHAGTARPSKAPKLTGSWRTDASAVGTAAGRITFGPGDKVELAPDNFEPLRGTYRAAHGVIDIAAGDRGRASLGYWFTDNGTALHLQYENGMRQRFVRLPAKAKP